MKPLKNNTGHGKMYRICKGKYPNHNQTMNWGRFLTWTQADQFLKTKLGWRASLRFEMYTIIDNSEIPF